ncbi:hypothetical protein ACWIG3_31405 [Streptomyces celluloflavus]
MPTQTRATEQTFEALIQKLRTAAPSAGIDLPELHVDYGEPGEQHLMHLGRVDNATARELARIVQPQREPFPIDSAVVDTLHIKVGKVLAIHGECLVLGRSIGDAWDALSKWCRPATHQEVRSLTAVQKTDVGEPTEGHP